MAAVGPEVTHAGATSSPSPLSVIIPASPSPTSPIRPSRLRGLSYLRNYTRPSVARATSYPIVGTSPTSGSATAASPNTTQTSPTVQRLGTTIPTTRPSNPEAHIVTVSNSTPRSSGRSNLMSRTRSATATGATESMPHAEGAGETRPRTNSSATASTGAQGMAHQLPSIRFTGHQDPRAPRPSLVFTPMARVLPSGKEIIKVGRYSERDNVPSHAANVPSSAPVGFKSKVVSRRHCEFWCTSGRWFIKDVKSSSGTFLNHIRLSSPGTESRPFPVNDGDIVQLGIDFKGGEEMIFRCVKIRVELNKGWQVGPSAFNVQSHKRLRELNSQSKATESKGSSSQDCSICLGPIAPCQSLFVAPCSHTWHYKCIRVIINGPHWPHFVCPNCRSVADLEADLEESAVEEEEEEWEQLDTEGVEVPVETTPLVESQPRQARQIDPSEQTYIASEPLPRDFDEDHISHSDEEAVETSDDSDAFPTANEARLEEAMGYLQVDTVPSPPSSASSNQEVFEHATVQPLDIVRKPISGFGGLAAALSSRTPSPGGLPTSLVDGEGPMTPRNDAGPFVFDGNPTRPPPEVNNVASTLGMSASPQPPGKSEITIN